MSVKVSFIVTVIDRDIKDLFRLLDSYKNLEKQSETEMIIEADSMSKKNEEHLGKYAREIEGVRWYIHPNTSRCCRKDFGMNDAKADYLIYIDADCVLNADYYIEISKLLGKYKVIRGKNLYLAGESYLSKCNRIYRTLCDEVFFYNETFTPNLIIEKAFLKSNGGWVINNTDAGDDYTLSQLLKQNNSFVIGHCEHAIVEIMNSQDDNWKKIIRTWKGYGSAYQVRRKNSGECSISSLFEFIPPFVYEAKSPLFYLPVAFLNWVVLFAGYIEQILIDGRRKR